MLKFPTEVLARSLEDLLCQVAESPVDALSMPIKLDHGGAFGGAIHALQVLASWSNRGSIPKVLRLPPSFGESAPSRERFSSTLPGMAALYFSEAVESGNIHFDRYGALQLVAPRVAAMRSESLGNTIRGQAVALCCFGGAKSEFLSALYSRPQPGGVRDVSDFRILISRLLDHLSARARSSVTEDQLDYLSGLVYQLFLNADEHGSYNQVGDRYDSSMRGVVVRHTTVADEGLYGADAPFQAYLNRLLLSEGNVSKRGVRGRTQLVEISVFDTGPGIALRWLGDKAGSKHYNDFSIESEMEAVQMCFQKHATTKASSFFGQGLSMALDAMRQLDAFMTLRTGRLSLYQDMMRKDTASFSPVNRFPHRKLAPIAGTGYTICFRVK